MATAPLAGAAISGIAARIGRDSNISLARSSQPNPAERLTRLGWFRQTLNHWHIGGRQGPMPQPRDHGLRLRDLSADEVIWPGVDQ